MIKSLVVLLYLHYKCSQGSQCGQQYHAAQPAQVNLLEEEEARPAQLLGSVGRVPHVVHPLHVQLLDQAAAHVAELVKAVLPVVTSHATVT